MSLRFSVITAMIGAMLLTVACSKDPDFQFEVPPSNMQPFNKDYIIKNVTGGTADILWVIDNSGSMGDFQSAVIANMDRFIQTFVPLAGKAKWRMGLISTDQF